MIFHSNNFLQNNADNLTLNILEDKLTETILILECLKGIIHENNALVNESKHTCVNSELTNNRIRLESNILAYNLYLEELKPYLGIISTKLTNAYKHELSKEKVKEWI